MNSSSKDFVNMSPSKLTVQDVSMLLELFQQLEKTSVSKLPPKDNSLWEMCLTEARSELDEQLKRRQSQFIHRPEGNDVPKTATKQSSIDLQANYKKAVEAKTEKKYGERDRAYAGAVEGVKKEISAIAATIDHTLYASKEQLLKFDRTKGTLLVADWREIRDDFSNDEIMQFQTHGLLERTIDALKAIKLKLEREQRIIASGTAGDKRKFAWFWRWYETTVKAFFAALLDKLNPS